MSNPATRFYLDHNATTPLDPRVADTMREAFGIWGNPSSIHAEGRRARDVVETARRQVAQSLEADISDVVFTSGGTEADVLGIRALAALRPGPVVISETEHPAALGTARQLSAQICRVDSAGRWDTEHLESLGAGQVIVVSLANHEIGTIQDAAAIVAIARSRDALVHVDAVQAYGKMPISVRALGADTVAISAHKVYGPKGVGALWIRPGLDTGDSEAGHQERGRRPGTENVAGIAGLGRAAALIGERLEAAPRIAALGESLAAAVLTIDGACVTNLDGPRLRSTVHVRFAGAAGDVVVQALDLAGFATSTGAACTSGSVAPSGVLRALGLSPDQAAEGVRLSLGVDSTAAEIEALLEVLPAIIERARQFG